MSKTLIEMQREIREVNEANGWFDSDRSTLEGHMLIVTEVAEASEAFREHKLEDVTGVGCPSQDFPGHLCKPEGIGSEYADILIRLLDQCDREGIDLDAEYERKIAYNKTRGYRHGGKNL